MRRTVVLSILASSVVSVSVTLLVLGLFSPAGVLAQGTGIRSNEYVLVASDGSERARLFEAGGGARFALTQGNAERISLAYGRRAPESAAIAVHDMDSDTRVAVGVAAGRAQGTSGDFNGFRVFEKDGTPRVRIGMDDSNGLSFIELLDASGNVIWSAP